MQFAHAVGILDWGEIALTSVFGIIGEIWICNEYQMME